MSGSGREWTGVPPGYPGGIADVREWWEALSDVRKALRISRSGRESLSDVWEFLEGCHGNPGVVGMPSRMSRCVRKAHPDAREALSDVQEWSRVPPGCP